MKMTTKIDKVMKKALNMLQLAVNSVQQFGCHVVTVQDHTDKATFRVLVALLEDAIKLEKGTRIIMTFK